MTNEDLGIPVIDSHVHLFPKSEIDSISWLETGHPLDGQYSVEDFRNASKSSPSVSGFVVVENDRIYDLDAGEEGWEGPLKEISWYRRLALGEPKAGEGHVVENSRLVLGLVPWAPLPNGPAVLETYLDKAKQVAGPAWPKVKGFRYLLQDKAPGTALRQDFVESLKLLGRRRFVFELCVDYHHKGKIQLDDTVELIKRAHADVARQDEQVIVVLNHMLKPNLTGPFDDTNEEFRVWAAAVTVLGKFPRVYMKLSGALSEMSESTKLLNPPAVAEYLLPWFKVIIQAFGPQRIIFASDWPVCTIGVENAWAHWKSIVEAMCTKLDLDASAIEAIFAGTAKESYNL
ncbi:unnamed protein product [Clonostachys byssicola]|uniref:Amidohydrolase-related domain-containing protein n=1 Tax=Clonostachys byssicola TaxID=160290 RepID=A0A9N9U8E1_9HYPO|nr:unnamed protein product [Clonostachys byssicola]